MWDINDYKANPNNLNDWDDALVTPEMREADKYYRMCKLNEQLKKVFSTKFPLCGTCLEFHNEPNNLDMCGMVQEMMYVDRQLMWEAIG